MSFEPALGVSEPRAGGLHEPPEPNRVIGLPQVHQLMDEDVFADVRRHEQQAVVERDIASRRTRSPARALIADGHPPDGEAVLRGQGEQLRRQLALRLLTQRRLDVRRPARGQDLGSLAARPVEMAIRKPQSLTLRSAPRDRHAQIAIRSDAQHVAARIPDAHEMNSEGRLVRRFEWKPGLHVSSRGTSSSRQTPFRATACCSAPSAPSVLRLRTRAPAPVRRDGEAR